MRLPALVLLFTCFGAAAACGDSNSAGAHFDGDTGLTAGVCSDGAACQSFARRGCDRETSCSGEGCG